MKKKYISVLCAMIVMTLCSVSGSYAWESLNQTALNVFVQEAAAEPDPKPPNDSGGTDKPGQSGKPQKPADPDPDHSDPQKPSSGATAGTVQNGKSDMTTGDTCQFVFYVLLMLCSFAVASVLGALLIALTINEAGKRRR